jgi:hypothetical protein
VVVHEAVGVAEPVVGSETMESVQEEPPVAVFLEDGPSGVAAGGEVVERSGIFEAQRPGHGRLLARPLSKCQDSRPDPKSCKHSPFSHQ